MSKLTYQFILGSFIFALIFNACTQSDVLEINAHASLIPRSEGDYSPESVDWPWSKYLERGCILNGKFGIECIKGIGKNCKILHECTVLSGAEEYF